METLRWSREREPVFFSPKLGYWVVTRYDDVKAVFRNNVTFSPAIALEKITPNSDDANAVLARYGYAMNRTLVNEDEPVHMERRRALLHSFLPEELVERIERQRGRGHWADSRRGRATGRLLAPRDRTAKSGLRQAGLRICAHRNLSYYLISHILCYNRQTFLEAKVKYGVEVTRARG